MVSITKAKLKDSDEILALQKLAYQSEAKLYNDWQLPTLIQSLDSRYKIGRLIVYPDYQRQGIGSALLTKIESLNISSKVFELFTGSKSLNNIRLYEKQGYKITTTKPLSEKIELVFMEKTNTYPLAGWNDLSPGAIYCKMFGKV